MPTQVEMKTALQHYVQGLHNSDAKLLSSLFSDHAKIQDPFGLGRVVEGREAIDTMYKYSVDVIDEAKIEAPIVGSHGNYAAVAFSFVTTVNGIISKTHAIDVMTFDDSCKIVDMKAYWGSDDNSRNLSATDYDF
ncbi:steroid delta-isomerase [Geomicrobium sp. JCM 19037]|uniref:nuclear transport factor 2 family protein n=1 Tax=Geomicrobium sp. JCM 19037 TaxID=1460634 RepID=UPI00045F4CE2|nr:nuclear transport factor 2 family protein [Geomicrobium sp. JCM 19037]GAK01904.1 steroid delta-isomerase [Geomicrobium sp. JCM 19037]